MRHGLFLPPFAELAEVSVLADVAAEADGAGWDGVFLWDHILRPEPMAVADTWVALGVMAHVTQRVLLGPMVTPVSRRRPHKLSREAVSVDRLSRGRLILGLGLGVDTGRELSGFGEVVDERERAAMLDEGMELLDALWSGDAVHHRGAHYVADDIVALPGPWHDRIPVWLAARTTNRAPLRRAARRDGLFAIETAAEQLARMVDVIAEERGGLDGFNVAVLAGPERDRVRDEAIGVTWWMDGVAPGVPAADVLALARRGPA